MMHSTYMHHFQHKISLCFLIYKMGLIPALSHSHYAHILADETQSGTSLCSFLCDDTFH